MAGNNTIRGDETVTFTDNLSFDGTERGGKLDTDGQLWMGATDSPHVRKAALTSTDGSVTMTYSEPTSTTASLDLSAGGGGGLVFLASATASTSASLDFTSIMNSTYNSYFFFIENIRSSSVSGVALRVFVSDDNGSTYHSTYRYAGINCTTASLIKFASATAAVVCGVAYGTGDEASNNGNVIVFNTLSTDFTGITSHVNAGQNTTTSISYNLAGQSRTKAVVDAVQFKLDSGTIDSGTIKMYGMTTPS